MAGTQILEPRRSPVIRQTPEEAVPAPLTQRPAYRAFRLLRAGFAALPILAGADKFFHVLANWDMYLANSIEKLLPFSGHTFMLIVGAVEIAAGILVAVAPRLGAFVVSAWLCGIIVNLLLIPGFYDVALRDFGLALGACALGILAREFQPATRKTPVRT